MSLPLSSEVYPHLSVQSRLAPAAFANHVAGYKHTADTSRQLNTTLDLRIQHIQMEKSSAPMAARLPEPAQPPLSNRQEITNSSEKLPRAGLPIHTNVPVGSPNQKSKTQAEDPVHQAMAQSGTSALPPFTWSPVFITAVGSGYIVGEPRGHDDLESVREWLRNVHVRLDIRYYQLVAQIKEFMEVVDPGGTLYESAKVHKNKLSEDDKSMLDVTEFNMNYWMMERDLCLRASPAFRKPDEFFHLGESCAFMDVRLQINALFDRLAKDVHVAKVAAPCDDSCARVETATCSRGHFVCRRFPQFRFHSFVSRPPVGGRVSCLEREELFEKGNPDPEWWAILDE